ncbi:MAG TPA: hypothetical protein VFZ78_04605 [Flavisolibacter sp.]
MKNHAQVIHFSGYPLEIAEDRPTTRKRRATGSLIVVKSVAPIRVIKSVEDWVNDPRNWDERWFCSYE